MYPLQTWGLIAAALLGSATGVVASPSPARRELKRRATRNIATLRRRYVQWRSAPRVDASIATDRLKNALCAHPQLGRRRVWVDAHGATILLHGIVESDAEWRLADRLARSASPDGSVRNLLQVRRTPATS